MSGKKERKNQHLDSDLPVESVQLDKKLKKKYKKVGFFGKCVRLFLLAATILCFWCLYCYGILIFQNNDNELQHADAGIVLGAALWNNEPSPALRERLDEAIALYNEGLVDYLILSGGRSTPYKALSEAEGMSNYLVAAGIPEDKLLLEMKSTDTYENLLFSKEIAEQHDLQSYIIITHNYHGKRSADIAKFIHMESVQVAGVKTQVLNESYHYTREVFAYTKWQINKLLIPIHLFI